jgi:mRNA-degrading endonuclease toxin of MazEF toxin-antitoxin module
LSEAAEVVGTTIVIPLTEDMGKVGLRTLSSRRIRLRLGMLPREKISEIEQRVAFLLGLPS